MAPDEKSSAPTSARGKRPSFLAKMFEGSKKKDAPDAASKMGNIDKTFFGEDEDDDDDIVPAKKREEVLAEIEEILAQNLVVPQRPSRCSITAAPSAMMASPCIM